MRIVVAVMLQLCVSVRCVSARCCRSCYTLSRENVAVVVAELLRRYLVDPASSHMLVSKIKPCMSKYKLLYSETANGSLYQL